MKTIKFLIIIIIPFCFSCVSRTGPDLEIKLDQIHIDYHNIESMDSILDSLLYAPENIGFVFNATNNAKNTTTLALLTKFMGLEKKDEFSCFKMIYKNDTIILMTIVDTVEIRPGEKIDIIAELPYKSYFKLKEIFNGNLKPLTLKEFSKAKFIYSKKNEGEKIRSEIIIDKVKTDLYLIYSDTAIVLQDI